MSARIAKQLVVVVSLFPCDSIYIYNEYGVTPVVMEPPHRRYARADAIQHLSLSRMSYVW